MAQTKLIITIDMEADNFEVDKPDNMPDEFVIEWLYRTIRTLEHLDYEGFHPNATPPENIVQFPNKKLLTEVVKDNPPPVTTDYQPGDWLIEQMENHSKQRRKEHQKQCQHNHIRRDKEHVRLNDEGTVTVSTQYVCSDCDHTFTEVNTMNAADYKKPMF